MTLTRILPTLRRTLPEPLHPAHWPAHTRATVDDVVVAGVSMIRLAAWCGTPCLHTDETLSVIVTRVQHLERRADGSLALWFDADVSTVDADMEQARLVGRLTVAPARRVLVGGGEVELPGDLVVGDLVVIPARSMVTLHEVDPRRRGAAGAASEGGPASADEWSGRCGR
ncbi:hypothetical protein P5G50_00230 [Leifsonia sp. F6_8S_P_1B]|uniref:Uncharacterized protein n=1 Tax=Leifsonia williamsii TaxID=3035919 RepID=A0ABT8K5X5_9MICO|nr:hypothetical protein [Leifsonia williamsii]MDN4612860.1 hypothetical protein [Leifsonia williamsii]